MANLFFGNVRAALLIGRQERERPARGSGVYLPRIQAGARVRAEPLVLVPR